jgi:hypothetical protein
MYNFALTWLCLVLAVISAGKRIYAAEFFCPSGNVACLIAAINEANQNGQENTINLAAGTYTLTSVDNTTFGSNGLPVITGATSIRGENAKIAIIARDSGAPGFRIFDVAVGGRLTLDGLTVRGGFGGDRGGGIRNRGILKILQSLVRDNRAIFVGGGIYNESGSTSIINSTITRNGSTVGGGIASVAEAFPVATVTIQNSTISDNGGGGLENAGNMSIINSAIAGNISNSLGGASGIDNSGALTIANSTIARNAGLPRPASVFSGVVNRGTGTVKLQNTIVALNFPRNSPDTALDCFGPITSLGNNILGDPTDCGINLLATDRTGDPGLGPFVDSGAPGTGRFPLLETSQAIDAGNNEACSSDPALATDQLGTPRRGLCDIGAIEFYPPVNGLVVLTNMSTDFDPTPVPGGPAGTFRITAEFTNTSAQLIGHRFAEVIELSGENLLLNADGGPGGVGARLTSPDSASTVFLAGATETFEFVIGLQQQEPFAFLVNMLGDPQTLNTSVTMLGEQ